MKNTQVQRCESPAPRNPQIFTALYYFTYHKLGKGSQMKSVYLVNVFRPDGIYKHTCNIAFTSRAAADKYARDCGLYAETMKVELCSLSDF